MSVYKDDLLPEAVPSPLLILQKLPVMSVDKNDLLLEAVPSPLPIPQKLPVMSVDKDDLLLKAVPPPLLVLPPLPLILTTAGHKSKSLNRHRFPSPPSPFRTVAVAKVQ